MKATIKSHNHFDKIARDWRKTYDEPDFEDTTKVYPANSIRAKIALALIDHIAPRKIIDVGCGSGEPMIEMLRRGHKVEGFDLAPEMVNVARENLKNMGYDPSLVTINDMENPKDIAKGQYDCIVGLGVYPYAQDFYGTMKRNFALLDSGGHIIFSLRNELLSLFSLNPYSLEFLKSKVLEMDKMSPSMAGDVSAFLENAFAGGRIRKIQEKIFDSIDDLGVICRYDNPLTIEDEILSPNDIELLGMYWYHYHAAPPIFEHRHPSEYRRLCWEMEDPTDWRGLFMTSTFVVLGRKR